MLKIRTLVSVRKVHTNFGEIFPLGAIGDCEPHIEFVRGIGMFLCEVPNPTPAEDRHNLNSPTLVRILRTVTGI